MGKPPITVSCECGTAALVAYGERWTCPACERTWDTSQIPQADYDCLLRALRRYRLITIGPPLALATILVPLAIFSGIQYAFLLFILVMAYSLLVLPRVRARETANVRASMATWELHPE